MTWLDKRVSLYRDNKDTTGRPATCRDILFSDIERDRATINKLRTLKDAELTEVEYKAEKTRLKDTLQGYTPAALLQSRRKGQVLIIERTGMLQLDFDYNEIQDFDIEELKQCVFSLPFIGYCGLSCSGTGFYALASIDEPERLHDYAEHCFEVLAKYGVKPDTGKGRNPQDLRYLSYDTNALIRENPEPLRITNFRKNRVAQVAQVAQTNRKYMSHDKSVLGEKMISEVLAVNVGCRYKAVTRAAFTLGGSSNNSNCLYKIIQAIRSNRAFLGEEKKYIKIATDCFHEGQKMPLK